MATRGETAAPKVTEVEQLSLLRNAGQDRQYEENNHSSNA